MTSAADSSIIYSNTVRKRGGQCRMMEVLRPFEAIQMHIADPFPPPSVEHRLTSTLTAILWL